jgi:hypothetical protein
MKSLQNLPPFVKGDRGLPAIGFAVRRGGRGDFVERSRIHLDPGSLPGLRDLAGMTNCDIVSRGKIDRIIILRSKRQIRFSKLTLLPQELF